MIFQTKADNLHWSLVVEVENLPHGLMAKVGIFTHGEATTSHHKNLGVAATYGLIMKQIQPFPHLPPRLTFATPTHTSNKILARGQLVSTQFSPPNPRSQVDLNFREVQLTQKVDDQNNLV
ncbi:hypothetical protein GBA52_026634 [Prunus armeniaca]|nr:hypothetical protein GBA52_026634 [Prunus armeniaca]